MFYCRLHELYGRFEIMVPASNEEEAVLQCLSSRYKFLLVRDGVLSCEGRSNLVPPYFLSIQCDVMPYETIGECDGTVRRFALQKIATDIFSIKEIPKRIWDGSRAMCNNESVLELMAMLAEEAGEVVQAVTKAIRHGLHSYHPDSPEKTNRANLEEELSDILAVLALLSRAEVVDLGCIAYKVRDAVVRKMRYMHSIDDETKQKIKRHLGRTTLFLP